MRVLVCGSRNLDCRSLVFLQLDALLAEGVQHQQMLTVIEGGCPSGGDFYAHEWVKWQRKMNPEWVEHEHYPADWSKYGRAAGHIRNQQMLDEGRPDIVLAFVHQPFDGEWDSRGTRDMCQRARKAGVSVFVINEME